MLISDLAALCFLVWLERYARLWLSCETCSSIFRWSSLKDDCAKYVVGVLYLEVSFSKRLFAELSIGFLAGGGVALYLLVFITNIFIGITLFFSQSNLFKLFVGLE